jgi:hypothetical protein
MHYINQNAFGGRRVEKAPLSLTQAPSRSRALSVVDSKLTDAIAVDALVPSQLTMSDSATKGVQLVRIGFTITPLPDVVIRWLRFAVRVVVPADIVPEAESPDILSVYPARVDYPMAEGRIGVDDTGKLTRESTVAATNGANVAYAPNLLGLRTGAGEAVWNWIPIGPGPLVGSDALLMSLSGWGCVTPLRYRRSLHAAVERIGGTGHAIVEQVCESAAFIPSKSEEVIAPLVGR